MEQFFTFHVFALEKILHDRYPGVEIAWYGFVCIGRF